MKAWVRIITRDYRDFYLSLLCLPISFLNPLRVSRTLDVMLFMHLLFIARGDEKKNHGQRKW